MKINWGTGLAITLGIYIIGMGTALYMTTNQRHDLVTTDYYQRELAYQATIDSKKNAATLLEKCTLKLKDQHLTINFPKSLLGKSGSISVEMYFPTKAENDFSFDKEDWIISTIELPAEQIKAGKWIAKIHLKVADKSYYFEPEIVL
jgi:hypothetical protein